MSMDTDPSNSSRVSRSGTSLTGINLLHDPFLNKGTAFSESERDALKIRGLVPPRILEPEVQALRIMENLRRKPNDLERYIFLALLQDRNETLFYQVLTSHMKELMPIIYTPTVGEACQKYGHIYRKPKGLFISSNDRGRIRQVVANWPHDDVRVVVVTDGERILGLGDLGAAGMGIPVGKLSLYTACAGIPPQKCLPVTIDTGTENESFLRDPLYIGLPQRRVRGKEYDDIIQEFIDAVTERYPKTLVQLEDFGNRNAFRLLEKYRDQVCLFNDDIQGTGSVTLAGILASERLTGIPITGHKFLILGAGEAGIGIADQIVASMLRAGLDESEARERCWFTDSRGLIVSSRDNLVGHKKRYAHDHDPTDDLLEIVKSIKPTGIIGVTGIPGLIDRAVSQEMARLNERPILFALSNPTSRAECTARQAYEWTDCRAIFASGSPFDSVDCGGVTFVPGQSNNAYVFPGVGLGIMAAEASRVPDEMFLLAADVLAGMVSEHDLSLGRLFPSLRRIREVSLEIGIAIAEYAFDHGLARIERPDDLRRHVADCVYEPVYPELI
jgi:malate dehydrogenase (oxaloacetate-decarboxylating)(NADP+)